MNQPETFKNRIKKLRLAGGFTQKVFAERMFISRGYLNGLETGREQPTERMVQQVDMMEKMGASGVYPVDTERAPMVLRESAAPNLSRLIKSNGRIVPPTEGLRMIPVLSWAHAGQAVAYEQIAEHEREQITCASTDPQAFAVIVEGDSMLPDFKTGDRIIVAPSRAPSSGKPVVVKLADDGILIRLFHRLNSRTIRLTSLNPDRYPATDLKAGEYHWVWPVEEQIRKY